MSDELVIRFRFAAEFNPARRSSMIQQVVASMAELIGSAESFSIGPAEPIAESQPAPKKKRGETELAPGWENWKTVKAIMAGVAVGGIFDRETATDWMVEAGLSKTSTASALSTLVRGGCLKKDGESYTVLALLPGAAAPAKAIEPAPLSVDPS